MGRVANLVLVTFLVLSASGLPDLVSAEPCSPGQSAAADGGGCAATCVRCSCCAHPSELFAEIPRFTSTVTLEYPQAPFSPVPIPESREILHIPKAPSA